jgi:hypothetical protein
MQAMIGLLRKIFWIALFLVFTLVFITLFEHGWTSSSQFIKDFKTELNSAKELLAKKPQRKPDTSDAIK